MPLARGLLCCPEHPPNGGRCELEALLCSRLPQRATEGPPPEHHGEIAAKSNIPHFPPATPATVLFLDILPCLSKAATKGVRWELSPDIQGSLTGPTREPHRSTSDPDQRYYGEAPVRQWRGDGERPWVARGASTAGGAHPGAATAFRRSGGHPACRRAGRLARRDRRSSVYDAQSSECWSGRQDATLHGRQDARRYPVAVPA